MKKLIFILVFLFIVSCKEDATKSMDMEALEVEEFEINANSNTPFYNKDKTEKPFGLKELTLQKFQELYDLTVLKNKHPEFKESIELQLKNFTNDTLLFSKILDSASIKNIQFITKDFKTSDSLQRVKLRYDFIANNIITSDSIYAEITSEKIMLEGKVIISNKIKFTKE